MDSKLRKILTDCIRNIETGSRDVEACLQQHPDRASELRPHLELWTDLNAAAKAQPNFGSQQRGRQQMLGALSDMERGKDKRKMIPALAKVAVVMTAAALLVGGAAGASAALGGPDITDHVLNTVGINNAPDAAQNSKDHANPNAFDGADNASENGAEHANSNAHDGPENAGQGIDNASDNANPDGASDDAPNASDSVPDEAQVPESVPVGPTP